MTAPTGTGRGVPGVVDVGPLGMDAGAHVLVQAAIAERTPGERVEVRGTHPDLPGGLAAWCRRAGHTVRSARPAAADGVSTAGASSSATHIVVELGVAAGARRRSAERAGGADAGAPGAVAERARASWGLAPRGALVEPGGPEPRFRLDRRDEVWSDRAGAFHRQAMATQWDPAAAIDWAVPIEHGERIEDAVVQLMTFLVENEQAALVVPARFLGDVHPHYREVQQGIAATVADEARHVEVFSRRATLTGRPLGLSTVAGRTSLQTLLEEPDLAVAMFLLSVMGEGTFVSLLTFLERCAPDPVTRRIARLTRADEARHVAFSMALLERHVAIDRHLTDRLAAAVERRHRALQHTAGLDDTVHDALVLVAAGCEDPAAIGRAWREVQALQREMADARAGRLARLGFGDDQRAVLAGLHSRNFM